MIIKKIGIIINHQQYFGFPGQTILEEAKDNKINIPFLCFYPDLATGASCGVCLVEVEGKKSTKSLFNES